jgi:hypothetical protein
MSLEKAPLLINIILVREKAFCLVPDVVFSVVVIFYKRFPLCHHVNAVQEGRPPSFDK